MTDENKDVKEPERKKLLDDISDVAGKHGNAKNKATKNPKGPEMLNFGLDLLPKELKDAVETSLKMNFLEQVLGSSQNMIDQKFSIQMPYNNTCKAYLQTKSGYICVNDQSDLDVAVQILHGIATEIEKERQKEREIEKAENIKKQGISELPQGYGIDQQASREHNKIDQV